MAKLHSLLVLQQFMRGLGEDMEEAELVRSTNRNGGKKKGRGSTLSRESIIVFFYCIF